MTTYNQVEGSIDPFINNHQNYISNYQSYTTNPNSYQTPKFNPDQKYLLETPGVVDSRSHWIDFWGVIVGIIITVLLALLVAVLFWPRPNIRNEVVIIEEDDPVNNQTGSSLNGDIALQNGSMLTDQATCTLTSNRIWNASCSCINPFYGPQCELESHTNSYNAIGNPNINDLILNLSSEIPVDRLSFPLNTSTNNDNNLCTSLCDNNANCTGVIYNPAPGNNFGIGAPSSGKPSCQLITGSVTVSPGNNIPYTATEQSKLYMKNSVSPNFKDRVFVYVGERPIRPWLQDSYSDSFGDNRGRTMFEDQLVRFNWTPTNVINGTGNREPNNNNLFDPWYGVFSNQSFEPSEGLLQQLININSTLRNGNSLSSNGQPLTITGSNQEYILISPTSSDINIPASWRNLWGAFIAISVNNSEKVNNSEEVNQTSNNSMSNDNSNTTQSLVTRNSSLNNEPNRRSTGGEIPRYRTSQNAPSNNQTIETTYRQRRDKNNNSDRPPITHTVRWNRSDFPSDGTGRQLTIQKGDRIKFSSSDGCYHDLASADANWFTTSTPFNLGTANPFTVTLDFNSTGTYYVKDRINPLDIRMMIEVK